jgi:hypothetical protein
MTNVPDFPAVKAIVDYIFRWIGMKFLSTDSGAATSICAWRKAGWPFPSSTAAIS